MSPRIFSESLNSLNKVHFLTGFKHICHIFTFRWPVLAFMLTKGLSFPEGISLCTPKATSLGFDEGLVRYTPVCIDEHDVARVLVQV